MKKILISTGGTGGHVIPAKIIAEHLKDDFDIYYSTDERGLKYLSKDSNKNIIIDTPKIIFNYSLPFKFFKLIYLIFHTIYFLKKEKIKKVISTGGYMSIPVIVGAKLLGLSIILLEPNLVLGRANKFFLNFSKKIFCMNKIKLMKPKIKIINFVF